MLPRLSEVKGLDQGRPDRKWWGWVSDSGLSDFRVTVLSALELQEPQGLCPGGQGRLRGGGGHSWGSHAFSKGEQHCRQKNSTDAGWSQALCSGFGVEFQCAGAPLSARGCWEM